MKKHKTPKSITIIGYRWRDKVNGNTYHRSKILLDGKTVTVTEFQYGYGDQYYWTAGLWLDKQGVISLKRHENGNTEPLWQYCDRHKITLEYWAEDLNRKRDLLALAA